MFRVHKPVFLVLRWFETAIECGILSLVPWYQDTTVHIALIDIRLLGRLIGFLAFQILLIFHSDHRVRPPVVDLIK